jgi:hypothetical protein
LIYLPLRLAASVPVCVVMLGALMIALTRADGRQIHPVYGLPNAGFYAFFAGIVALLLVLPNVLAAAVANRIGAASYVPFALTLCAVVFAATFVELRLLDSFFKAKGGLIPANDWRPYAILLVDVIILLGIAAWHGRSGIA